MLSNGGVAQPAAPLRHGAHGRAAGSGANHHDLGVRVVGHQEGRAKRTDHVHRVAYGQVAQEVGRHAAHRGAVAIFEHAFDGE